MESIIMIVLMFALLYFMLIRPEKKRKQQAQQMRDGLKKGDTITTIGGIIGKVVSIDKDTFVIETSEDRVRVQFAKWALSTVGVQTGEQPEAKRRKSLPLQRALILQLLPRFLRRPLLRQMKKNKLI